MKKLVCWILSLLFPFDGKEEVYYGEDIEWSKLKSQEYQSAHAGISSDFDTRKEW